MTNKSFLYSFFWAILFAGFILSSCGTPQRIPPPANIKVSAPRVFNADFQKALYKTDMMIYGSELSGLCFIKKTDSSYRVVCMSEVGLKFFDLEFFTYRDENQIHFMADFLDRKAITEKLLNFYDLIFMVFTEKTVERYYNDETLNSMVKEYKLRGEESRYYYDTNFGTVNSIRQKKSGDQLRIYIKTHNHSTPLTINSNQEFLNLRLEYVEP